MNPATRRPSLPTRPVVLMLVLVLVLTGCAGVPGHSRPQVVATVTATASAANPVPGPGPADEPRSIVLGFLRASLVADARHSGARQYLTSDASSRWQDVTVTVLNDYQVDVPTYAGGTATVTVSGQPTGALDSHGVFTPESQRMGVGARASFTFDLRRTAQGWRIVGLPAGVLIRSGDFVNPNFTQSPLYFYDNQRRHLVPDLRYSALNGQGLADWLLSQLLAGPQAALGSSVQSEIPDQADLKRVSVSMAEVITFEIPGSSALNSSARTRLAAELAFTFSALVFTARFSIHDSGKPVTIPDIGTVFSTRDFPNHNTVNLPAVPYYLRDGRLISGRTGQQVAGGAGSGGQPTTWLDAVAIDGTASTAQLAARTRADGLFLGSVTGTLTSVRLPTGAVSSPEWDPVSHDLWVGVGGGLYRVVAPDQVQAVSVPAVFGAGLPKGRIITIRFSPDGARLALVVAGSDGSRRLWIGSVTRTSATASVQNFSPITPWDLIVVDFAWKDQSTILMVAAMFGDDGQLWSVFSDGFNLQTLGRAGLPSDPAEAIAAAPGAWPLVASAGAIWVQQVDGSWRSLIGPETTPGDRPLYAVG